MQRIGHNSCTQLYEVVGHCSEGILLVTNSSTQSKRGYRYEVRISNRNLPRVLLQVV
jgi:hypothetical protein